MKHRKTNNNEYKYSRLHTYKYKKLSNGTLPYSPIHIKFWLWGFSMSIETRKSLRGFALNSSKAVPITLADKYVYKVRNR